MAKRPFSGLLQLGSRWMAVHRERQLLMSMSDEALKDIGLNRGDVEQESRRHFWEDPLRK